MASGSQNSKLIVVLLISDTKASYIRKAAMVSYCDYTFEVENPVWAVRSVRSQPPAHYKMEIKSFSVLSQAITGKIHAIESTEFSAGHYNWTMCVYPDGNSKDDGEGHLSMYLKMVNKPRDDRVIDIIFRFFIYDYAREQYLTIQDSTLKHYDSVKDVHGIPRALSLVDFKDSSNGFINDDCCTFGVEIYYVNSSPTVVSLDSTIKPETITTKHSWHTKTYPKLGDPSYSEQFNLLGRKWKLKQYPDGYGDYKGSHLGLYLELVDVSDLVNGKKVFAEFELRLKSHVPHRNDYKKTCTHWFDKSSKLWGYGGFITHDELTNCENELVPNGVMHAEVTIKTMFVFNHV